MRDERTDRTLRMLIYEAVTGSDRSDRVPLAVDPGMAPGLKAGPAA